MHGCSVEAASASSVGASQQKALALPCRSHLRIKTGSTVGKEGLRVVPTPPVQNIHNCSFNFLMAENTLVKYPA